jgi:drug/metabolite transporter (DMT)-like permease
MAGVNVGIITTFLVIGPMYTKIYDKLIYGERLRASFYFGFLMILASALII